jgi:pSer/pThr/pTyr-binding forkhead associated (FHA) protein
LSTWLTAWRNREDREPTGPVMELLVVAGADAGGQFTLEGDEVLVGRGQPASGQIDVIRLDDKSISRKQAWIRRDGTGTSIEHIPTAANPTLVNGAEVSRARLSVGDRVEMGRVAIDVRAREGINLSGLTEIMEGAARESTLTGARLLQAASQAAVTRSPAQPDLAEEVARSTRGMPGELTDVRPVKVEIGDLIVARGVDELPNARFPITMGSTTIGRGEDADVQIPERGVSRLHAEIEIAGRSLELVHRSGTNRTFVNGFPVVDRVELENGDEIQLADRVVLRVALRETARPVDRNANSLSGSALSQRMEDKLDLEREIEEYSVMGSFLDVDVVESRKMKGGGEKAEHIIVSFDRFRSFVSGICEEFDGQVLNSNGDELMCFFESPGHALLAGSTILERLDAFNEASNLLGRPFRFRLGAHTGVSLVDLSAGIAYSDVLDTAGHIQKQAEPDTLLISEQTFESVREDLPVTSVGELAGDGGTLYRVDRFLTPEDVAKDEDEDEDGAG